MKLNRSVLNIFASSKNKKYANSQSSEIRNFEGQKIARRYCLYAVFLFAVQGVVATLGATDLIFPGLPSPVPYAYGRAVHLNLSTTWPLIGSLGMVYYFTTTELRAEIFSLKIARWQFWIIVASTLGLYGSLSLRIGNGREFLEGLPIFYLGIALSIALGAYNLIRTLLANKQKITPATGIMAGGLIFLLILLVPNTMSFRNPIADEAVKFWVVHLWEEMAFELTTAGFVASFFVSTGLAERRAIERWLYLEATLSVAAGLFGTGHHYYWIGFPASWLLVGLLFSIAQVIPVFLLVHLTYKGLKKKEKKPLTKRGKLTLWLLLSSLFHHITGAALLGLFMAIPWINLYAHGTYTTSAHAHFALFGALGFWVLGGCYYILSHGSEPKIKDYILGMLGVILLNTGLLIMGGTLLIAGFLQSYLWRYLGLAFIEVQAVLKPYLLIRALGGGLFTLGDLLLSWRIIKVWWDKRTS